MTTEPSPSEFEARIAPHRSELHAYCYRMLGSLQDAEDALQEALLGAWLTSKAAARCVRGCIASPRMLA